MHLEGFTEASAWLKAGVYALAYHGEVVYVGKAKCLMARVNTHRQLWARMQKGERIERWIPVKGIRFDEVFIRPCRPDLLDQIEREMINLYKPRLNVNLKTKDKVQTEIGMLINGVSLRLNAKPDFLERRV